MRGTPLSRSSHPRPQSVRRLRPCWGALSDPPSQVPCHRCRRVLESWSWLASKRKRRMTSLTEEQETLMSKEVLVITGAGGIGQAIARRQGPGRSVLLADFNEQTLQSAAKALEGAGLNVRTQIVDVSTRES